jgi:hypothetical protein
MQLFPHALPLVQTLQQADAAEATLQGAKLAGPTTSKAAITNAFMISSPEE